MTGFLSNDPKALNRAMEDQNREIEENQAKHAAGVYGLPYLNMINFPLDLNSLALMTKEKAESAELVPFFKEGHELKIATTNPKNQLHKILIEEFSEKYTTSVYYVSRTSFAHTLSFYNKVIIPTSKFSETISVNSTESYLEKLKSLESAGGNTTELLTTIFGGAVSQEASDIHMEPEDHLFKIRYRVDGVLHDAVLLPKPFQKAITSRLKLMAKLKLNIDNESQDGRITILKDKEEMDVRVSVLPSSFGEAIVLRLLGSGAVSLDIDTLGLNGKALTVIQNQLAKPNGMIITTGPTGSGKTTTLYAFLRQLNKPGVKIITLEDPVEYKVDGIQQTPIDHRVDFSFVKALRAVLRQDPDVVMVGEIRDPETAETSLQAALTGHVVLTTLHTNDATGAIPRLLTMGVKPFVIAPAVNAIIAQRLVRRLCPHCIKNAEVDEPTMQKIKAILDLIPVNSEIVVPKELQFYKSSGCDQCAGLGYKGRVGVYEVMEVSDQMKEMILTEPSGLTIRKMAIEQGTISMAQDGLLKALNKMTDITEVFRVTGG